MPPLRRRICMGVDSRNHLFAPGLPPGPGAYRLDSGDRGEEAPAEEDEEQPEERWGPHLSVKVKVVYGVWGIGYRV